LREGRGIWGRASTDAGAAPDVVLACCGDVATMEALVAAAILREALPDLKLRFVQPASEHPHGSTAREFDTCSRRTGRSSSTSTGTRG
jgi:xylulose-5-phosphate/fructose-6-phosphate phosphoketolase